MALGQNPFNPSHTLPTLAAIQQRHRELLAYQARQEAAQALATPNEEETYVPEEFPFTQQQEEQQENDELQEPYAEEESEPSVVLPLRSSGPHRLHWAPRPSTVLPVSSSVHLPRIPRPIPPPSSSSSWRPSATLSAPPRTAASVPPVTASISSSFSSANRARPAKGRAGARSPASSPEPTRSGLRAV
jgi:hypothetical protein